MSSNSEYIEPIANDSPATSSPDDEIDSLPDSAPSDDIDNDEEEEESDAEKEWKESLQQLELILTMVLVPYAGKYFGRKCAYWGESEHCVRMRSCRVVDGLTIKRVGEIHGVEVPSRSGLYEQEDIPSNRSCRSRRLSMIPEVFSRTHMARELRDLATSLCVEENARVSAMSPRGEAITRRSKRYLSQ